MVETKTSVNFIATVISNRRITIPDTIVDLLEIKQGDFVKVFIEKINSEAKEAQ